MAEVTRSRGEIKEMAGKKGTIVAWIGRLAALDEERAWREECDDIEFAPVYQHF
jgi:hypothetical protein